ncbi:WCX domain-containing protein [Salisaeta longa]|uniref:WYL domain-containing protein n=1 Tax=Salisaeta longa TaxID=503170 RepID=UPI0003B61BD9|nr:WYL domain-containing protein [Salisaeta longa]
MATASAVVSVSLTFDASQHDRLTQPGAAQLPTPVWNGRPLVLARAAGPYQLIGCTPDIETLVPWILSFGASVGVDSPASLRRHIAAEARALALRYAAA